MESEEERCVITYVPMKTTNVCIDELRSQNLGSIRISADVSTHPSVGVISNISPDQTQTLNLTRGRRRGGRGGGVGASPETWVRIPYLNTSYSPPSHMVGNEVVLRHHPPSPPPLSLSSYSPLPPRSYEPGWGDMFILPRNFRPFVP